MYNRYVSIFIATVKIQIIYLHDRKNTSFSLVWFGINYRKYESQVYILNCLEESK